MSTKERNDYWIIDGCDTKFCTFRDLRNHTTFWTEKEVRQYHGSVICHMVKENAVSVCTFDGSSGKPHFSRLYRLIENELI